MPARDPLLRPSLADFTFDRELFERLRGGLRDGSLDLAAARLPRPPRPLAEAPPELSTLPEGEQRELREMGEAALAGGKLALLVMNGGMATRFGGGAKGVCPVLEGRPELSFVAIKLAQARQAARAAGGRVPVALMHSFATRAPSLSHLQEIAWAGLPAADRLAFDQSVLPRVTPAGDPLAADPAAAGWPDTDVYAAPGHGDTLGRLRASGTLAALRDAGAEHVLVSNVDNLGALPDPLVLGAHLRAVQGGAAMTVEVVPRREGDAGGCVALHPDSGAPAIVEGFRLPVGTDLAAFPHFNTNTLYFRLEALREPLELQWFAVRKRVALGGGPPRDVVQFEQLIGQASELLPTAFVVVDRDARFLPIKTRDELAARRGRLAGFARGAGLAV